MIKWVLKWNEKGLYDKTVVKQERKYFSQNSFCDVEKDIKKQNRCLSKSEWNELITTLRKDEEGK